MKRWLAIVPILIMSGCSSTKMPSNVSPASNGSLSTEPTIEGIISLPPDFRPSYHIAQVRDVSFSNVKRYAVSIRLPAGLGRHEVELNFKHAILETYRDKRPNAITVWGYEKGDDVAGNFTVGDAVFAPFGKWESAGDGSGSLQNYEVAVNVKDAYLRPREARPGRDVVTLMAQKSDIPILQDNDTSSVRVWNDYGNRYDTNVLMRVPNGTKATVIGKKRTGAGDYVSTAYRVRVKRRVGWVDFFDIKEYKENQP